MARFIAFCIVLMLALSISLVVAQADKLFDLDELEPISASNVRRLEELGQLGFGYVEQLEWADDTHLSVTSASGIRTYDISNLNTSVALSEESLGKLTSDGQYLVYEQDQTLYFLDAKSGKRVGEEIGVFQAGWLLSPTQNIILTVHHSGALFVHDIPSGEELSRSWFDVISRRIFSPDGETIALNADGQIYVKSQSSCYFCKQAVFGEHISDVGNMRFSHDNRLLIVGENQLDTDADYDGYVWLWDAVSDQLLFKFELANETVRDVRLTPDGTTILALSGSFDRSQITLRSWQLAAIQQGQTEPLHHFTLPDRGFSRWSNLRFDLSRDGRQAAFAGRDDILYVWNVNSAEQPRALENYNGGLQQLAFSPDSRKLAYAGLDGMIHIWEIDNSTGAWTRQDSITGYIGDALLLALSPDGRTLARPEGCMLELWQVETGQRQQLQLDNCSETIDKYRSYLTDLGINDGGNQLLSVNSSGEVRLWDLSNGEVLKRIRVEFETGHTLAFTSNGSPQVVENYALNVWDVLSNQMIAQGDKSSDSLAHVTFASDGTWRALIHSGNTLRFVNLITDETYLSFDYGRDKSLAQVAFSADGRWIAGGGDGDNDTTSEVIHGLADNGYLALWSLDEDNAEKPLIFEGHTEGVKGVQFNPDSTLLISSSRDDTIRFWDITTGEQHAIIEGLLRSNIVFSADGRLMVAAIDGTIRYYGIPTVSR
jgi:WD40 repeat protein